MNYVGREPTPGGVVLLGDTNPVGSIVWGHKVPDGSYLQLNGQIVSKTTYAELWGYAGSFLTTDQTANPGLYRSIDASTFALPKLDGLFLRAAGQVDASHVAAAVGVKQADGNLSHSHTTTSGPSTSAYLISPGTDSAGYIGGGGLPTNAIGGVEARPVNVALVASVKALSTVMMPSVAVPAADKVLLLTVDIAAGTVQVDMPLSSGWDVHEVVMRGAYPQTNDAAIMLRGSIDNGATFLAGGTDYDETYNIVQSGTNFPTTRNGAFIQINTACSNALADGGFNGTAQIYGANLTGTPKHVVSASGVYRQTLGPVFFGGIGRIKSTSPVTHIRLSLVAGNFAGGRLKLYGLR